MGGHRKSGLRKSIISRIWKLLRWPLLVFLLIWVLLAANAWKYFSEAGAKGLYFSAIHAVDVLRLPAAPAIPNVPDGLRSLNHEELRELSNGSALQYTHPPRRLYGRHVVFDHRFTSVNEYTSSSNLAPFSYIYYGRYLVDKDRICNLPKGSSPGSCYKIYRDKDGNLFEYVPATRKYPAEWQAIEFYHEYNRGST